MMPRRAVAMLMIGVLLAGTGLSVIAPDWPTGRLAASALHKLPTSARASMAALRTQVDETWQTARPAGLGLTVDVGASLLQRQIVAWRERAIEEGTQSVPGAMKSQLVGYFPESLLDRVRYRIGWSASYSLQSGLFRIFSPKAVALVDVIVFRDAALAADPVLWAHELAHVQQYDSWGASEFARSYVRDHSAVEVSAWNVAASYTMWALQKE